MIAILSKIAGWFGGVSWLKVGAVAGILGALIYGVHRMTLSYTLEAQNAAILQEKKDADIRNQADIQLMNRQYTKDIQIVTEQKDAAVKIATTANQQLEEIKHGTLPKDDSAAAPVLVSTIGWVRGQPDPYRGNPKTSTSADPTIGRGEACAPVLKQSQVATYIINQFSALESCRSQLAALRDWATQ